MKLKGACHCGKVTFSVSSKHPYPYNLCYCSICRKTAGSGGFVINLNAQYSTLEVTGREHITIYHAKVDDKTSPLSAIFVNTAAVTCGYMIRDGLSKFIPLLAQ